MTLNKQLLCISLLLLTLPWAGYQYLLDMSESLEARQISLLENNSQLIAQAISQAPLLLHSSNAVNNPENTQQPIYCFQARRPIRADGYVVDNEWTNRYGDPLPWSLYSDNANIKVSYRCSIFNGQIQLLFDVNDANVSYRNPSLSSPFNGDRLILQTGLGVNYVFATAAAGKINPIRVDQTGHQLQSGITATWVDQPQGYQIEMTLPHTLVGGQLSFIVVNQTGTDVNSAQVYGPGEGIPSEQLPTILYPSENYQQLIAPFAQQGMRVKLLNPQGWLLAEAGTIEDQDQPQQAHWLLQQLYKRLLKREDSPKEDFLDEVNLADRAEVARVLFAATHNSEQELAEKPSTQLSASQWYLPRNTDENSLVETSHHILASAAPIFGPSNRLLGAIVAEQSSQQTSDLTDQAFNRLFLTSALTLVCVIFVIIGYASWLSWRIRRLSNAARNALEGDDALSSHFPNVRSKDEVGDLARDFSALLQRVDEYTEYLKDLSRKLSHELRTPLAIIHSSLDNLSNQPLDENSNIYQERAKEGASRLGNIITAMSEARRVEESLAHTEFETVNIVQILRDLSAAYQDLYHSQKVKLTGIDRNSAPQEVTAAPDLLVQMIDKIMDNAHSFCPSGGSITMDYHLENNHYIISISNEGPLLPEHMQNQLFDNLVSIRSDNDGPHLGMGLHIAQLICEHHNGKLSGKNRACKTGVIFTLTLPVSPH